MEVQLQVTHCHTPTLMAIDPRGLALRSVDYYRAGPSDMPEAHVERTTHDLAGRAVAQWDARLFHDSAPANLLTIHALSGTALCTVSVDAGWRVSLFGEAGQLVQSWDGRGSQRSMHYDDQVRLSALFEQVKQGEAVCAERLTYATNDQSFADHNQCGRLISHADAAGVLLFNDYGLAGATLAQERHFHDIAQSFPAYSRFNPLGDLLSRTDAQGNEQVFRQTLDGQFLDVDVRLSHTNQHQPMVSAVSYNAHGQVEREVAGNGVITTLEYAAEDGRLQRLLSRLGQNPPLQDLRYSYDPVGNVRSIEDAALPIRYFANQRIEPFSHFWYDTLDRLIAATGWEAGSVKHGPSSAMTADPAMPGNYRQTYRYDAGNNLLELTHVGPQNPGHRLVADAHSNRCLPVRDGMEPTEQDFSDSFDANGNLLKLQPGQTLHWDARNQLCEVRPVARDAENDSEQYVYGADGLRVRKVRSLQTNAQTNIIETLYLPGLEIRTHSGTGEVLHVINVATGRGSVRVLHWAAGRPSEISNNQQRYSLTDHLGSSTLELDQHANVITQERFYPFGGTAWWNGTTVQVSYKTVRYSGKERDATGLYYYGFRYYIPWLQRWLNPDPAGHRYDLNLFCMVRNRPSVFRDELGLAPILGEGLEVQETTEALTGVDLDKRSEIEVVSYRVKNLGEQLALADERSQGRAELVDKKFTHKVVLKTIVMTEPKIKDPDKERVSKYFNEVKGHEWEFKQNYKFPDSGKIFANDVFRKQYRVASARNSNFGELPSFIRRSKVKNQITLDKTRGLEDNSPELMEAFFQTPNGKSTTQVLLDFGLIATGVTREPNGKDLDFLVAVKPVGAYEIVVSAKKRPPEIKKLSVVNLKTQMDQGIPLGK